MHDGYALIRGVEAVWIAWAIGLVVSLRLTVFLLPRLQWRRLRALLTDESGTGYTISYTMTLVLYLLFVLLVLETTFMLVAKYGVIYSAFAAARAAIVWHSSAPTAEAEERVEFAAQKAFIPFANGVERLSAASSPASDSRIEDYISAYQDYVGGPIAERYVRAKALHAVEKIEVKTNLPPTGPPAWDSDITVTVTYQYVFHIDLFGPFFTQKGSEGKYEYPIASIVTLQNEGPRNEEQRMGIAYGSRDTSY
jgi:hypothetical protein